MYFPWDCVTVDEGGSPFSKDIEALKTGNAQLLNEYLDTLLKYWNGEIDEVDFTPISIPAEVDSEMQKDSFY